MIRHSQRRGQTGDNSRYLWKLAASVLHGRSCLTSFLIERFCKPHRSQSRVAWILTKAEIEMEADLALDPFRRQSFDALPTQGPRPRLQLTCEPCRLSKIKCDRSLPTCEQCRRRSRGASCKYKDRISYNDNDTLKAREELQRLNLIINTRKQTLAGAWCNESPYSSDSTATEEAGRMMGSLKLGKDGQIQLKAPWHWESIVDDVKARILPALIIVHSTDTPTDC